MRSALAVLIVSGLVSGLVLGLPSCSFLGLDNLPLATCTRDSDCASLAAIPGEAPPDDCHTWQCAAATNPADRHCEIAALDADEDGAVGLLSPSMMMCPGPGDVADCDDADGATSPNATEMCNGVDNDCDGDIDEGAENPLNVCRTTEEVLEIAVGIAEVGGLSIAEVLIETAGTLQTQSYDGTGEPAADSVMPPGPLRVDADALSDLAYVRPGEWALTVVSNTGCRAPFLQRYGTSPRRIGGARVDLPTLTGPTCAGSQAASVAVDRTDATRGLITYLDGGALSFCDSGVSPAAPTPSTRALLATTAAFPVAGDYTSGASAVSLGESVGSVAPALLSVGANSYLVAAPQADRTIDVLSVSTAGASPVATVVYTEPAGDLSPDGVVLARGPSGDFALAWGFLCPGGHRVRLFSFDGTTASPRVLISGDARPSRLPSVTYHAELDEWLVTFVVGATISGQRFGTDGMPIDDPFEIAGEQRGEALIGQALTLEHAYRLFGMRDPVAMPPVPDLPVCMADFTLGCLPP